VREASPLVEVWLQISKTQLLEGLGLGQLAEPRKVYDSAWVRQRHLERAVSSAATFLAAASQRITRIAVRTWAGRPALVWRWLRAIDRMGGARPPHCGAIRTDVPIDRAILRDVRRSSRVRLATAAIVGGSTMTTAAVCSTPACPWGLASRRN
jgi:hypothetical protein